MYEAGYYGLVRWELRSGYVRLACLRDLVATTVHATGSPWHCRVNRHTISLSLVYDEKALKMSKTQNYCKREAIAEGYDLQCVIAARYGAADALCIYANFCDGFSWAAM